MGQRLFNLETGSPATAMKEETITENVCTGDYESIPYICTNAEGKKVNFSLCR